MYFLSKVLSCSPSAHGCRGGAQSHCCDARTLASLDNPQLVFVAGWSADRRSARPPRGNVDWLCVRISVNLRVDPGKQYTILTV